MGDQTAKTSEYQHPFQTKDLVYRVTVNGDTRAISPVVTARSKTTGVTEALSYEVFLEEYAVANGLSFADAADTVSDVLWLSLQEYEAAEQAEYNWKIGR
jgi:hypothetical protein